MAINTCSVENALKMIESLPVADADEPGLVIYRDTQEYPDEQEGNLYAEVLSTQANAKNWIIADGENDLLSIDVVPSNGHFRVFPSVANDRISIDGVYDYAYIFTADGQCVAFLKGEKTISTLQFPEGLYIIKAFCGDKQMLGKVIVKH